jgi:hypothetical protein
MHRRELTAGVAQLVDTGETGRKTDISPWVGLRFEPVESLLTELCDLPPYDFGGTVAANVGYILNGEYQAWRPPATAAIVIDAIDSALQILDRYRELDRLEHAWTDIRAADSDPNTGYRRVIVQMLLGDRAGVDARLTHAETIYCSRANEICDRFREFRTRVLRYMASV